MQEKLRAKFILFFSLGLLWVGLFSFSASLWAEEQATTLESPKKGIVTGVPLNAPYNGCLLIRGAPTQAENNSLGFISNGEEVTIEGQEGSWYKVSSPKDGYVWASYVKVTETGPMTAKKGEKPITLEENIFNSDPGKRTQNIEEGKKFFSPPDFDLLKSKKPELYSPNLNPPK